MKVKGGRGGTVRLRLDETEASLLRNLIAEMQMLLEADIPDGDAVKQRLFPRAYEDPANEETFRDLTSGDLENAKLAALREVRDSIGERGSVEVEIGPDDVGSWLRLLTDLRLAIGVRLDVTEETMSAEIDPDDPNAGALSVLHWLGWVQGSILERIEG
ncbi:MAG: DUF2017 domain-containing protein [Actinobacteria bacterium]|nr:DUF2017 domain-containing protein [Actinomycetota bacterium]